jgi:hypothetical protein
VSYRYLFISALAVVACGPADVDDVAQDEPVGSSVAAIQDGIKDRAAVALVNRQVRGTVNGIPTVSNEVWAFACDAKTNYMKKRTKRSFGWELGWTILSTSGTEKCSGAPTAARLATTGDNSSDILAVYWRGVTGSLVEGWYRADGTMATTDLSARGWINFWISGPPVINDVSSPKWVSVAVKSMADNGLYTVAWYDNAYQVRPVLLNGSVFKTTATNTLTANYNMFDREYITAEGAGGVHHIFSRPPKAWTTEYSKFDETVANDPRGVVTMGGGPLVPVIDPWQGPTLYDCGTDGCALYRNPNGLVRLKFISSGATTTRISPDEWISASIFNAPTGSSHQAFAQWDGRLINYDWVSPNIGSGIIHVGRDQVGGESVESGITVLHTTNGNYLAAYQNAGTIWLYDHSVRSFTNLGLTPLVQ